MSHSSRSSRRGSTLFDSSFENNSLIGRSFARPFSKQPLFGGRGLLPETRVALGSTLVAWDRCRFEDTLPMNLKSNRSVYLTDTPREAAFTTPLGSLARQVATGAEQGFPSSVV